MENSRFSVWILDSKNESITCESVYVDFESSSIDSESEYIAIESASIDW